MRAFPFLAAPVAVAISLCGGSARADDGTQARTPQSAATTPTAAASSPAQNVQTATTASGEVVVVAPAGNPNFRLQNPAKKMKRVWYGWQTLALDGAAIVGGVSLAAAGTDLGPGVWFGTYALGPPIVHLGHRRVGIAFADLGMRVGAPIVGFLIGAVIACRGGSSSSDNYSGISDVGACEVGAATGFLVGYASAIAIDAAVFARETVPVDDSDEARELAREKRKRASTFTVFPDVGVGQNRATLGLHGMF